MEETSYYPLLGAAPADDCLALRETLARHNYSESGIKELIGELESPARNAKNIPRMLYRTRGASPLAVLVRLFLLDQAVEQGALREALDPIDPDDWVRYGLLAREGSSYRANVEIVPNKDLLLAADFGHHGTRSRGHVLGVTNSALALAFCTPRQKIAHTLDLGTGNGIQAFLAAPHSDSVCATDFNPMAIEIARFNAKLNGISNIEFLTGDRFQPVQGRRFNLIVSNPPFMVSPEPRYTYRDSGLKGDEFCQSLIRGAPEHLSEGAYYQMLTDWVHLAGQDWKERVASWFQGSGCAARVLHLKTFDPPAYAEEWLRYTEPGNAEAADALFERWMEYYKSEGIEAISRGIIMVRRSERARNWVRFDEAPRHMGPFSDYVQRSFAVGDFLEGASSNDLLEQRLRLSKDVRLRQVLEPGGNGWNVALARFELTIGPHYEGSVDRFVLALVGRCDGRSKLRDLFGELASGMGADPHRVIPACLPIVRQMLGHGVLLPEQVAAAGS